VGHSAGAQLILSILENIDVQLKQAILVSAYAESLRESVEQESKRALDWKKIRQHVQDIVFINSDDDPWGCDDKQGRILFEKLGGTQIIRQGEGHMGSTTYNQAYKTFPLLAALIS
jgi:uncharacterized protein